MAQHRAQPAREAAKRQAAATKVLFDNGRVRVQEVTFKPGDQGPGILRPFRVIHILEGGTMRRTGLALPLDYLVVLARPQS